MRCTRCDFDNPAGFQYCGKCGKKMLTADEHSRAIALCHEVNESLTKHLKELERRPPSERSRMAQDFEDKTGMSAQQAKDKMQRLEKHLKDREFDSARSLNAPVRQLAEYFQHLHKHTESSEKDPVKRKETLRFVGHCASTAIELAGLVATILA